MLLGIIGCKLGNLPRQFVLPLAVEISALASLQQRLFKTGGCLIQHPWCFILLLADSRLTQRLFRQILLRTERRAWHRI